MRKFAQSSIYTALKMQLAEGRVFVAEPGIGYRLLTSAEIDSLLVMYTPIDPATNRAALDGIARSRRHGHHEQSGLGGAYRDREFAGGDVLVKGADHADLGILLDSVAPHATLVAALVMVIPRSCSNSMWSIEIGRAHV